MTLTDDMDQVRFEQDNLEVLCEECQETFFVVPDQLAEGCPECGGPVEVAA